MPPTCRFEARLLPVFGERLQDACLRQGIGGLFSSGSASPRQRPRGGTKTYNEFIAIT